MSWQIILIGSIFYLILISLIYLLVRWFNKKNNKKIEEKLAQKDITIEILYKEIMQIQKNQNLMTLYISIITGFLISLFFK